MADDCYSQASDKLETDYSTGLSFHHFIYRQAMNIKVLLLHDSPVSKTDNDISHAITTPYPGCEMVR